MQNYISNLSHQIFPRKKSKYFKIVYYYSHNDKMAAKTKLDQPTPSCRFFVARIM